jgi:hypothetical protein
MFCLECGAEMAVRARACPVCGHVYGDRERALADSGQANRERAARQAQILSDTTPGGAAATPAARTVSGSYTGDLGAPGLPRDLPGRFVLAVSLGLAADLLLPWVSINGDKINPASIGAPVVVVVALLAAATLPVYTISLRQHPIWSALPLIVGAFCAGIAGTIWLLLAPLTQLFANSFGTDPSNLTLAPEPGLYLFLLGAGALLVSGQRMLAATQAGQVSDARHDALRLAQAKARVSSSPEARTASAPVTLAGEHIPASSGSQPQQSQQTSPGATQAQSNPPQPATPATTTAPVTPVLPGSDAWRQAPAAPAPQRVGPGSGWGKSRGPQRLR